MSEESRLIRLSLVDTLNSSKERHWVQLKERKRICAQSFLVVEREERRDDDGLLRVWKTDDTNAPKAVCAVVVRAAAFFFFFFFFFFCPQSEDVSASCNG